MSSISKKPKNIFKNKIVLYSIIAVTVIAIGIVVWGAVTDWKFWNVRKKPPPPKPIPDYPVHHNCNSRFCKKCDITGERCEKGECIEGTENINGYCFKPPTHPCDDKKCAKCSKDGKKCETCASEYVLDDNGKCCHYYEKINGVCCDTPPCGDGADKKCCEKGKTCMKSLKKNATGCCSKEQKLDNDGNCCNQLDNAGDCCDHGTLCGRESSQYCCGNTGNTGENECKDGKCKLKCGGTDCNSDQNCDVSGTSKKCIDKSCEWKGDQTIYYPKLTYSSQNKCKKNSDCPYGGICDQKTGLCQCKKDSNCPYGICDKKTGSCQYYPIGLVPKEDSAKDVFKKNSYFNKDKLGNPYLFLFASTDLDNKYNVKNASKYRFSKVKSRSSTKKNIKCTESDCRKELGVDVGSETVFFNGRTSECLVEEETSTKTITPSSDKECPFTDKTRCCTNKNGHWSGQVCDEGKACVYDQTKQIGTCAPKDLTNNTEKSSGLLCGTNDTDKGSQLVKYDSSNQPYCDCSDKKLNSFNCVIPPECKGDKGICNGHGVCLHNSSIIKCSCDSFWTGQTCNTLDTDACRKRWTGYAPGNYNHGVVDDNSPYIQIFSHINGQTCSSTGPCKDDCCDKIKGYCGCNDGYFAPLARMAEYGVACPPTKTGCTACRG